MIGVFTEDAVFVTSKGPLHGQQEIQQYFADLFKAVHVDNHWTQVDDSSVQFVGPDKVWRNGEWCNSVQLPDGKKATVEGFWSAVEVKDGDEWKHQMLMVNSIPRESATTAQQKSLKELIVGTWLLDSVYDQTQDGEKHNPWGDGVKGQAIFTSDGHFSWQMMSANRPKADTSPREPVGQVVAEWGTYTVDDAAISEGTLNLAFPTENEVNITTIKPIQDPKMGPFVPHLNWKRAM